MARPRNPNRDKSLEIYLSNKGNIKIIDIAKMLNENVTTVRSWKSIDSWNSKINKGGAPKGNLNAIKHGLHISDERYADILEKVLPKVILNTMKSLEDESPLDKLWRAILLQETKILQMQKIIHVKSKKDVTKALKKVSKGNMSSEEYEIQFAWDKENSAITVLSKAMTTLTNMINQFEELSHKNWDLITEEQQLKISKLKVEVGKLNNDEDKELTIKVVKASENNGT
ncbi:MAG: phage terminase small subunit-related protein [Peptostreptococcaceae bacterium]